MNNTDGVHLARLTAAAALTALGSGSGGLDADTARRRLAEFGPNHIAATGRRRPWLMLARDFTHFFALILWFAAALAFVAEGYTGGEGMAELGFAIVCVILVNGVFSFWQTYRAEQLLARLRTLLPTRVTVVRNGASHEVAAAEIVPGDVLLLAEGDSVPADCRVIEAWGARANLSTLTGESRPRAIDAEAAGEVADTLAARNLLLAGTTLVTGECRALVYATATHTEFGRIAHLTQTTGDTESPLQREIRHVSRIVALLALALGVLFFVIGQGIGLPFWASFMFAIGIIVANVPEGLLPTVTLALALATQRMARRRALVRHLPAIEALGSATAILTDKTGTLTENRMRVRELYLGGRHRLAATRWPRGEDDTRLRRVARLCHSLRFPDGQAAGDPMEIALWEFGGGETDGATRTGEIAFEATRKRMSVLTCDAAGERALWCKGAPETVLPLCTHWLHGGESHALDDDTRAGFRHAQNDMADRGLRVLALAWKKMAGDSNGAGEADETGLELCGLVGLEDPPRADVHLAVERCREAGVRIVMITGDHPRTALALAREIGLVRSGEARVVSGDELRTMGRAQLQLVLDTPELLFARMTAEQKMRVVQAMQRKGEIVAVTGDGVNDAPALKTADIGIAMGRSGTDVAREAADIVLLDDHFATIVAAIEEGRAVYDNIRKFLTYILTSNIPEIVPYLAFVLFRIPLPLTVVQILAVDLGTDLLPALALGAEKPHPEVMRTPPRRRGERLLSWPLLARAYLFLGPLEALAAMAAFFFVLDGAGWRYGDMLARNDPVYLQATTACLGAIVLAQVVNLFVCRHPLRPALAFPLRDNPLLLVGIAVEIGLLLLIVYTPAGNRLFGTAPPPPAVWLYAAPFALLLGAAEEGRKWLLRKVAATPAAARPVPGRRQAP